MPGRWATLAAQDIVGATSYTESIPSGYNEFYVQWRGLWTGDATGTSALLRLNNDAVADYRYEGHVHGPGPGHVREGAINSTGMLLMEGGDVRRVSGACRLIPTGTFWIATGGYVMWRDSDNDVLSKQWTYRKVLASSLSSLAFNFRVAGTASTFTGRFNIYGES